MTKQEQNIAIAEVCGWTQHSDGYWSHLTLTTKGSVSSVPSYTTDLNAMHEAEKILFARKDWSGCDYEQTLKDMTSSWCWHATAAQRAEAFLKTLNLWKS